MEASVKRRICGYVFLETKVMTLTIQMRGHNICSLCRFNRGFSLFSQVSFTLLLICIKKLVSYLSCKPLGHICDPSTKAFGS